MKGSISILYIKTSQLSEEKIAIGAIGVFGSRVDIVISDEKLNFSFDLLQGKNKSFVLQNLNLFQNKINDLNIKSIDNAEKMNISIDFDKNYLSYLNAYSQGLIAFGAPMPVNINSEDANYYKDLMKKFVGGFSKKEVRKNFNPVHIIGEDFLKAISIHTIQYSKQKISLQKVIPHGMAEDIYELVYLLNRLKTSTKSSIEIELRILTDQNSTLSAKDMIRIFQGFNFSLKKTDLSILEVGLASNLKFEDLMKKINEKPKTMPPVS